MKVCWKTLSQVIARSNGIAEGRDYSISLEDDSSGVALEPHQFWLEINLMCQRAGIAPRELKKAAVDALMDVLCSQNFLRYQHS